MRSTRNVIKVIKNFLFPHRRKCSSNVSYHWLYLTITLLKIYLWTIGRMQANAFSRYKYKDMEMADEIKKISDRVMREMTNLRVSVREGRCCESRRLLNYLEVEARQTVTSNYNILNSVETSSTWPNSRNSLYETLSKETKWNFSQKRNSQACKLEGGGGKRRKK